MISRDESRKARNMQEHTNPKTTARRRGKRFPPVMLVVACLPFLLHCGGGGDGGGSIVQPAKTPIFTASGTASAANLVTLAFGRTDVGSLIQVDVKLGGPTTATNIYAYSFRVVLSNPSVVREVTYAPGDALTGGQVLTEVAFPPGDRVVVGVSKYGQTTPGNGVGANGATIVSLIFKMDVNSPGSTTLTFDPQPTQDPQGNTIDSIHFDSASAQIEQPK
jgi:hypothetical protein